MKHSLVILVVLIGTAVGQNPPQAHDGYWWVKSSEEFKLGVVSGYALAMANVFNRETFMCLAAKNGGVLPDKFPGGEPVPANVMSPLTWFVFSVWSRNENEIGRKFVQRFELLPPDSDDALPIKSDLTFEAIDDLSVNYVQINGFPVGKAGPLRVKMWLESTAQEVVSPVYIYPIAVKHNAPQTQLTL